MKRFDWIYESSSWVFRADWKQNKWKSNHEKLAELVMISSFWGNSTSLAMENGVFGPPIDGHEMMANVRLQAIGFWGRGGSIFVINSVDQCTFTSKDRTCIYQGQVAHFANHGGTMCLQMQPKRKHQPYRSIQRDFLELQLEVDGFGFAKS